MRRAACEFFSGGEVVPNPAWHMPFHSHQVHELIVVLGGRMLLETAERSVRAEAGDLLFYHAGHAHRETADARDPVNTLFTKLRECRRAAQPLLIGFVETATQ